MIDITNITFNNTIIPGYTYNDATHLCQLNYMEIVNSVNRLPTITFYLMVAAIAMLAFNFVVVPFLKEGDAKEVLSNLSIRLPFMLILFSLIFLIQYVFVVTPAFITAMNVVTWALAGLIGFGIIVWLIIKKRGGG